MFVNLICLLFPNFRNGQLVLVDSGCEYHGYSSDVTRVWPINGKFSKPQRELYEVILHIQKSCIKVKWKYIVQQHFILQESYTANVSFSLTFS